MERFAEKVAVVTGAGRGIGLAVALRLAAEGAQVAVISRTEANATEAAGAINAEHGEGRARGYAVDVADGEAMAVTGKQILEDFGKVDVLVNNAGVTRDGLFLRMSEADWDLVMNVNLKGAFNATKAFQRSILKQPGARILNVSSVVGLMGNAGQANYAASKAGLIGFTKSLAKEFSGRGVTVNAIAPGFIVTDMTGELTDEVKEKIVEHIPLKSLGDVDDVANVAAFLASEEGKYITGQVIAVDGGMVM
jgi:3-oxoacyl-[acyl-carrier protein] reductase